MFAAERVMLETDALRQFVHIPKLPGSSRVEANFLLLDNQQPRINAAASAPARRPHPALAGQVKFTGNSVYTVAGEQWNLPT